jgi:hypothetical protein
MEDTWIVIEDKYVRMIWQCPDCGEKAYIEPWFYSENGNPLCSNDNCEHTQQDGEMEYIRTEVKVN